MKIGIEIKKTTELEIDEIRNLNVLKNQYWKHEEQEHLKWFKENIKPEDWHLSILSDDYLIAYLNIIHVDVVIDENLYSMMGIGNVCVNKEHSGMGAIMMASANAFVKKMNSCGILLCKDDLVEFYRKSNWRKYNVTDVLVTNHVFVNNVMVYDPKRCLPESAEKIQCSRNF